MADGGASGDAQADQPPSKPDLFAGISDSGASGGARPDQPPGKPQLFAGADEGVDAPGATGDAGQGHHRQLDETTTPPTKPDLFAGADDGSDAKPDQPPPHAPDSSGKVQGPSTGEKSLGTLRNDGRGDDRTKNLGGNYVSVALAELDDDDIIHLHVTGGTFRFVHVHLRNSRGIWYSVYNGTNTTFRVGDLLKGARSGFNHHNFSVNGQLTAFLPVPCTAELRLSKATNLPPDVTHTWQQQWSRGANEIPNAYVAKRPSLQFKGTTAKPRTTQKPTRTKPRTKVAAKSRKSGSTTTDGDVWKRRNEELRRLVTEMNGVIQKADTDFNKPYWQEKGRPQTTMTAKNPKASTLQIMQRAYGIVNQAKFPENKATLAFQAARKLTEYGTRVFVYVG